MKKIVGIIAALALASAVFADPDIVPVQTDFSGNAELQWIADLDAETTGMKNSESATFKIKFINEGTKVTEGDGLWGELKIKAGTVEGTAGTTFSVPAATVETAKIHFIDGDTYFSMNIRKPDFSVGKINYVRAVKATSPAKNWEDPAFGAFGGGYQYATVATAEVDEESEYYYVDENGDVAVDKDGKKIVAGKTPKATKTTKATTTLNDYQGFTLNFGIPLVDLEFAFGDNGQQKSSDKEFAFKFGATVKPIENLNLYAGVAKCTADGMDDLVMAVTASYNYKIDDQFYIKPALQFGMVGKAMDLNAGLFFGWGSEGQTWNHDFLQFKATNLNVCTNENRAADGLSIVFQKPLKNANGDDPKYTAMLIEFYDKKLLSGLDIGGVTIGAAYRAEDIEVAGTKVSELGKGNIAFAAIYENTFDIVYLTAKASFGMDLSAADDKTAFKWSLRLGTKELIANTDLYAEYGAGYSKYSKPDNAEKGCLTVGTKISF